MSDSVQAFAELLHAGSPINPRSLPLTNVTFFLGAGFSKSWDERFPVGNALFSFTYKEWQKLDGPLEEFLNLINYRVLNLDIDASMFKDIVYQIGMMKKYPDMRPRYIDDQNLALVEKHLRFMVRKKFEATAPLYFEQEEKLHLPGKRTKDQSKVLKFFRKMEQASDGSRGLPEGLRANYLTTNYDFVIEAILDATVGNDDSYRLYKYRGITPTHYCGRVPETAVHDNFLVGNLLKINGGFEIFKTSEGFEFDYRKSSDERRLRENPPQLMLASREQDYTQAYFRAMFPKVIRLLQETRLLVVVGYSLPEEDALLRLILRQFAEDRADGSLKAVFYIDLSTKVEQAAKVKGVFPHAEELHGLTVFPYSGSFASWCGKVVAAVSKMDKAL
ncbi:MAG: hypothetical protein K5880_02340 [Hydrogenophaga sp.]|nr:hypothetical protein [Hydrogenophaga sp.]